MNGSKNSADLPRWRRTLNGVKRVVKGFSSARRAYNKGLSSRYSADRVAFVATGACAVLLVLILFIPPYLGVADDGSLAQIRSGTGLAYRARDDAQPLGAYFVRSYVNGAPSAAPLSSHLLLVRAAIALDRNVTEDSSFDIRFLALLYSLLYLPAVWLIIREAASRVRFASEGTAVAAVGVLLFGDLSYLVYFNSLYPEAFWFICLLYLAGCGLALQREGRKKPLVLLFLSLAGSLLALSEQHCWILGVVSAFFCLRQLMPDRTEKSARAAAVLAAAVLLLSGSVSLWRGASRFDRNAKLNAMTSGVLLESRNPEKSLAEFGIAPRFELLADQSSYGNYPLTKAENDQLETGFYDRYSTATLLLYYARHPGSMAALMETGARTAFQTWREGCGNYELTAGMPAGGQSVFFSMASVFKVRSMPKTLGYLALLAIVYHLLLTGRRAGSMPKLARAAALDTFWMLAAAGLCHMEYIILRSGSAELARYALVLGVCIDLMTYLVFAEILHRLNILETGEGS